MPAPQRPAESVLAEEVDDEVCLYRTDSNDVLVLNRTAGDVWRLVDGTLTAEGIVTTLAHAYGVAPDEIEADVRHVLTDLRARGFVGDVAATTQP